MEIVTLDTRDGVQAPGVVVFDLDGTLTTVDTFVHFGLGFLRRNPWRAWRIVRFPIGVAGYYMGLRSRDDLKRAFIAATIAGATREALTAWANEFAELVQATLLRGEAAAVLARHIADGDRIILATASLDIYADAIARRLGISEVLATRTAWTSDGALRAALAGPNLKSKAKRDAVAELIGERALARVTSYSDDLSDLELLRASGRGVLVSHHAKRLKVAMAEGLETATWK